MTNPLQRNAAWDFDRAGMLTGSNFAAAMGICPYKSRQKLWRELKGIEPPFMGNEATEWGVTHEPEAIASYEVITGRLVSPAPFITHPAYPWMGVSPDGLTDDGCIEAKCPYGQQIYGRVPDHYMPQVVGVIEVTVSRWCDFICWTPSQIEISRVPRSRDYWAWMFPLLEEFWRYVQEDREPPRLKAKPVYQPRKEQ